MDPRQCCAYADMEIGTAHYYELGPDCSGPAAVVCRCPDCQSLAAELDRTLTPAMERMQVHAEADAAIDAVRGRRRTR